MGWMVGPGDLHVWAHAVDGPGSVGWVIGGDFGLETRPGRYSQPVWTLHCNLALIRVLVICTFATLKTVIITLVILW